MSQSQLRLVTLFSYLLYERLAHIAAANWLYAPGQLLSGAGDDADGNGRPDGATMSEEAAFEASAVLSTTALDDERHRLGLLDEKDKDILLAPQELEPFDLKLPTLLSPGLPGLLNPSSIPFESDVPSLTEQFFAHQVIT